VPNDIINEIEYNVTQTQLKTSLNSIFHKNLARQLGCWMRSPKNQRSLTIAMNRNHTEGLFRVTVDSSTILKQVCRAEMWPRCMLPPGESW